ncbi:MAG: c-type cytochrome [Acidobacteriota bacterium]
MTRRFVPFLAAAGLAVAAVVLAPTSGFPQAPASTPALKKRVTPQTSPTSGAEMFRAYCAPCHGVGGKGDGPAAAALKALPANLTLLAQKNGGVFPAQHVEQTLLHGLPLSAHGSGEMPVWGPALRAVSGNDDAVVRIRIRNLSEYLKNLQAK